jgi:hypothetical protein
VPARVAPPFTGVPQSAPRLSTDHRSLDLGRRRPVRPEIVKLRRCRGVLTRSHSQRLRDGEGSRGGQKSMRAPANRVRDAGSEAAIWPVKSDHDVARRRRAYDQSKDRPRRHGLCGRETNDVQFGNHPSRAAMHAPMPASARACALLRAQPSKQGSEQPAVDGRTDAASATSRRVCSNVVAADAVTPAQAAKFGRAAFAQRQVPPRSSSRSRAAAPAADRALAPASTRTCNARSAGSLAAWAA